MSDRPAPLDRLKRRGLALAAGVGPRHVVVIVALAAIGVGVASVRAVDLPGPRPVLDGERLHIEVVTAAEPEVVPGSVMEVGDLVEGFEYRPPPRPLTESAAYAPHDEDFERSDPRREPDDYDDQAVIHVPSQPEPPEDGWRDSRVGRWFGFDAPERDYRAEREARRARREARAEQDRDEREVRRYWSDGPPDRRD